MKTRLFVGLIWFFLFFFISPNFIFANDYYVSVDGNDLNSGTLSQPLRTIQKGVDKAVNPGDQVLVMPGEYRQTDNYIYGQVAQFVNKHGQAGNEIVLRAYDPENQPVIIGYSGIRVVASSYITIDGLEVTDTSHSAFPLYLSDHITLKNNYVHLGYEGNCTENETGVYAGCTYYSGIQIGEIKGRHDKNGNIIVEHDGSQNTGIYMCKMKDSSFINNRLENLDESIYAGMAGDVGVFNCWYPEYDLNRTWVEGNLFEGNLITNSWNEAIELKPDTRNNIIRGNIIKSTRQFAESSQIEIRGHNNEVTGNIIVGSPKDGIRILSESIADPDGDRVETYKKADGSYKSAYRNNINNNYLYYWAQYTPSSVAISTGESGAATTVEHNTIVGNNTFTGKVSEYASIKTNATPETTIKNNLMIGARRVDYTAGSEKYESHLTSYANYLPMASDYNAYYPRLKSNNTGCVVSLGSLGIICQNNNTHNQSVGYEYHSRFMDVNPIASEDSLCSKNELLSVPIDTLKERIINCSMPVDGSQIISKADDGTNIGAYQNQLSPTATPTLALTVTPSFIPGDANGDGRVDGVDYVIWLNHYNQDTSGGNSVGDFNTSGKVDGVDYVLWLNNYEN